MTLTLSSKSKSINNPDKLLKFDLLVWGWKLKYQKFTIWMRPIHSKHCKSLNKLA